MLLMSINRRLGDLLKHNKIEDTGFNVVELDDTWMLDGIAAQIQESEEIKKHEDKMKEDKNTGYKKLR
jgi:hypothetical protein